MRPTIGIIGAGKVGSVLARLWYQAGYHIAAVYSRTPDHARLLARQVNALSVHSADEVVDRADLALLSVPDDVIERVAGSLKLAENAGKAVVHTSGALDVSVLSALAQQGVMTGSLHPAFPFSDIETAMTILPGATFAIEAAPPNIKGMACGTGQCFSWSSA